MGMALSPVKRVIMAGCRNTKTYSKILSVLAVEAVILEPTLSYSAKPNDTIGRLNFPQIAAPGSLAQPWPGTLLLGQLMPLGAQSRCHAREKCATCWVTSRFWDLG